MSEDIEITEYHLCSECKKFLAIPIALERGKYDLICLERRTEFNRGGGLSSCPIFEEQ